MRRIVDPTASRTCRVTWKVRCAATVLAAAGLAGCDGPQSALAPSGRAAEQIADLFWWMTGGAAVIWVIVIGLSAFAVRIRPGTLTRRQSATLIIGGGAVFPTIVLAVLLGFGLAGLPELLAPAPEGSLRIGVVGEQWWWRVRYEIAEGETVELANEIHLPVGEPVEFLLESPDVIHAFWIPSLGGKMDMIPGRRTRLRLEPTEVGVFRGACAEYCGGSHALMAFDVIVEERAEFERWLARQAEPAQASDSHGAEVFLTSGCGACHAIRGTRAAGVVGPDLTHVGSRLTLGASTLPNDAEAFLRWIGRTEAVKPEVHMPSFGMLPREDLEALAAYLDGLE